MRNQISASQIFTFALGMVTMGCVVDRTGQSDLEEQQNPISATPAKQQHCVSGPQFAPDDTDEDFNGNAPNARCFGSFSEAIAFATGGRVKLSSAVTAASVDEATLNGGANASGPFVVGILYDDANHGGSSYTQTGSSTCKDVGGSEIYLTSMPRDWNDRISSARTFAGCHRTRLFEHVDFVGAVVICEPDCTWVGPAMNDRTSSVFWD